jgi:hydrogenase-4 component E
MNILPIEYGNIIVTLMVSHLLASILAAEARFLKVAIAALVVQSALLCSIFATFAYLWGNPSLYWLAIGALLTKVLIIPTLIFLYSRNFPEREIKPIIGFKLNLTILIIFLILFYKLIYTHISFIAPTSEATVEPARSSLAIAFTIFMLGIYICIFRRDVIKIIIGLVLLENGAHLALVTLAPTLPETTIIGITTNVIVSIFLLLYLSSRIYKMLGTTDTLTFSSLRR